MQQQIIGLIQGLCDDVPPLLKSDVVSLSGFLNSAQFRDVFLTKTAQSEGNADSVAGSGAIRDEATAKEPKRIRLDHSCEAIIEQLMTPIMDQSSKRDNSLDSEKNIISPIGFATFSQGTKVTINQLLF